MRFLNVLLEDCHHPATLLLIEVKRRAAPAPGRNGVAQAVHYGRLLAPKARGYRIRRVVCAEHCDFGLRVCGWASRVCPSTGR